MECHGKEEGHCEPSSTSVTWECIVCGKINREEEKNSEPLHHLWKAQGILGIQTNTSLESMPVGHDASCDGRNQGRIGEGETRGEEASSLGRIRGKEIVFSF